MWGVNQNMKDLYFALFFSAILPFKINILEREWLYSCSTQVRVFSPVFKSCLNQQMWDLQIWRDNWATVLKIFKDIPEPLFIPSYIRDSGSTAVSTLQG